MLLHVHTLVALACCSVTGAIAAETGGCKFFTDNKCDKGETGRTAVGSQCRTFASGFTSFYCTGHVKMCSDTACKSCTQVADDDIDIGCNGVGSYVAAIGP